jgi:hemerythrin-like domain-containing protein
MQPIGPLMKEHRLIEQMIGTMGVELKRMRGGTSPDPAFIDAAADFIKTYADRCHHGKEEDIFFRDLHKKKLSAEHRKTMGELIEEHRRGRQLTRDLIEAKDKFVEGDEKAIERIVSCFEELVTFYPQHIEKEDRHFFIPCMEYFSDEEQEAMLDAFRAFDRELGAIHEKYKAVAAEWGQKKGR